MLLYFCSEGTRDVCANLSRNTKQLKTDRAVGVNFQRILNILHIDSSVETGLASLEAESRENQCSIKRIFSKFGCATTKDPQWKLMGHGCTVKYRKRPYQ